MTTLSTTVRLRWVFNGKRQLGGKEITVDLPVPDEVLEQEGLVRWPAKIKLPSTLAHQEGVAVRTLPGDYSIEFAMDSDILRDLLAAGESGTAEIDLPAKLEVKPGRELIRDTAGRALGATETTFATVSWIGGS